MNVIQSENQFFVNAFENSRRKYEREYDCAEELINTISEYLFTYRPKKDQTLVGARKMFDVIKNNRNGEKDMFDYLFDEVALKDPDSHVLEYYWRYKDYPVFIRKTVHSVLNGM